MNSLERKTKGLLDLHPSLLAWSLPAPAKAQALERTKLAEAYMSISLKPRRSRTLLSRIAQASSPLLDSGLTFTRLRTCSPSQCRSAQNSQPRGGRTQCALYARHLAVRQGRHFKTFTNEQAVYVWWLVFILSNYLPKSHQVLQTSLQLSPSVKSNEVCTLGTRSKNVL